MAVSVSITGGPNGTSSAATFVQLDGYHERDDRRHRRDHRVLPAPGNYTVKVQVNPCSGTASNLSNGTGTTVTAAAGTTARTST